MSSTGSTNHSKRLASETDNSQRALDNDSAQQLKMRERQRFFEEVIQQDVDVYLSSTHLQIDCRKPPMGSISSMEVNVDVLEQMDLMEISDQEALDVFLNSSSAADDGALVSPMPEIEDKDEDNERAEGVYQDHLLSKHQSESHRGSKSRMSSSSSGSSNTSGDGADTPVVQSDDEEVHADTLLLTSVPQTRDEETEEEEDEESGLVILSS